jgi:hypothetical protein
MTTPNPWQMPTEEEVNQMAAEDDARQREDSALFNESDAGQRELILARIHGLPLGQPHEL